MIKEKVFNPKLAPDSQIILDSTNDLICAFDKDYQLAYCNKSFKKNFELFVKESLDETKSLSDYPGLSRFVDEESKWNDWMEKAFSGEKFKDSIEHQIIGKKLSYSLEFKPIVKNNEVVYIQISAREDTLRKNYEDLLKKKKDIDESTTSLENDKEQIIQERDEALELLIDSAERLQIVFEGSSDGFWDWNIEKDEIFHSKQYYEILGYRNGELKSDIKTWQGSIHEDDVNFVIEALHEHMEGKSDQFICEYRILTKKGEFKWILDRGKVAIRDENNNPLRIAGTISDIHKRKKAEDALRLTQYTVDKSAISIFWYDKNARFFYTNEIACKKLGYTQDEMLKIGLKEIDPSWTNEYWEKERIPNIEENKIIKIESTHRKKNGELFPVEIIATQIFYEGEIVFVAFANDITERLEAETKIKESEARFSTMAENLPVMIWVTDNKFKPTYVNKMGNDFIGLFNNNNSINDYIHPDDLNFFKDILKRVYKSKKIMECEIRLLQKDGEYKWILSSFVPRILENGKLIGMLGIGIDITERKEIETKLLESETQFNEITSVIGDGIFLIDADWNLKYANPEFTNLLGYTVQELEGKNFHDIIHSHDESQDSICPIRKVFNTGETIRVTEDYYLNKQKELVPVSYVISPIRRNQKITGCVAAFHDVTERINSEAEMERFVEELQFNKELMEENANEFARLNEMLAESESRLKELNASKDKFFSIISHDLRSPFTSITGFAEVMIEDLDTLTQDEIKDFTGSIYKSSKNIQNLLENLLQWSRVQTGRIEFNPINFDLNNLANDVIALYQVNAARKKINLINCMEEDYNIHADKFMLDTVLRNLVSNSIKFTKQGGEISIKIEELEEKSQLQISVEDNGVGMKEEILSKLFKIDEHVTTKGTDKEKGTGLGLILCKEFIEKNGGEIWAESKMGEGSKFKFTIPYNFQ